MEPLLVLLFHPKWRTGLQQQNKTKIIEFDQKLAELWVVLAPNLTLKNVFGGHLGSRDIECRSKVTNILMFFESSMPLPCLCKVWSKFIEYFLIYIQLIVVVHILVKYLQTGHTGCPRMFYTVFQKNIKNIKSTSEPNYNTCNTIFDMCSSYCENFIHISLSIAM